MNGIALWQVCARYGQLKSEVVYICYSVTIESQVNGAYEDDSFCKEITFFFIFTRNEWGLEIVQVYTTGSFVLINILTYLR